MQAPGGGGEAASFEREKKARGSRIRRPGTDPNAGRERRGRAQSSRSPSRSPSRDRRRDRGRPEKIGAAAAAVAAAVRAAAKAGSAGGARRSAKSPTATATGRHVRPPSRRCRSVTTTASPPRAARPAAGGACVHSAPDAPAVAAGAGTPRHDGGGRGLYLGNATVCAAPRAWCAAPARARRDQRHAPLMPR